MNELPDLQRFIDAQQRDFETAFAELSAGCKRSHWMWYIFPQLRGLGFSEQARFYGITGREEAEAFLQHPVLGKRLTDISRLLVKLDGTDAHAVFGSPDDLKLKSCMTLFAALKNTDPVFGQVLDKYFGGVRDSKTLQILGV